MRLLFFILLFNGLNFSLLGQNIEIGPVDEKMPDAYSSGEPYYGGRLLFYLKNVIDPLPPLWQWTTTPTSVDFLPSTISLDPDTGKVSGNFGGESGEHTYEIEVTAKRFGAGGITLPEVKKKYTLIQLQSSSYPACPRKEYALVIDLSKSMGFPADKWAIVQGCVTRFLLTINPLLDPGDRLAVIFFNDTNATTRITGHFRDPWLDSGRDIQDTLFFKPPPELTPSGKAPLGAGLLEALNNFFSNPVDARRTIILFTDGVQNQAPFVTGAKMDTIDVSPTPIALSDNAHKDIKIMTIGIGAGATFTDGLRLLSNPDGEYVQADSLSAPEVDVFFTKTIPVSLAGCSPRVLDYRNGVLAGDGQEISESFRVNRFVDQLLIRLTAHDENAYPAAGNSSFYYARLYKDGVELPVKPQFDDNTAIFNVRFPFYFPDSSSRHDAGNWELRFTGQNGIRYDFMAMVEDEYIKDQLSFNAGEKAFAGDVIPVALDLQYAGAALDSAQVEAILLRPGEDLEDLASYAQVDVEGYSDVVEEEKVPLGQAKLELLMRDSAFVKRLRRDALPITLKQTAGGRYEGLFMGNELASSQFRFNEVTGTYRVVVRFSGKSPLGPYIGWDTKCAFVDFARPEEITLQDTIIDLNSEDSIGNHRYKIKIVPLNKFGRRIGPGQEPRIRFTLSSGMVGPVQDHLDGTYSAILSVPHGARPSVAVYVINFEKPVKKTCFDCIGKKEPRLQVPPDITTDCDSSPAITGTATILDPCSSVMSINYWDQTSTADCYWGCTILRNWYAVDDCGHQLKGVQTITVQPEANIKSLLDEKLVLGATQTTLTISKRNADCIKAWFPASGNQPTGLTSGRQRVDEHCQAGNIPLDASGHLVNPLLAETIRLELVARKNPDFAARKLSSFPCNIHSVVLQALSSDKDVRELLRVTNYALGNIVLASHLEALYEALKCINESVDMCGNPRN